MPIIKANEPLPEGPVVIGIYGEPGVSKTTIANTADKPLLCDFDRGSRRSLFRKDTLVLKSWADVVAEEQKGTFKEYKTIIIDTAKSALDDFLMSYVVENNAKLRTNKLQAYGAIGDEFKLFLNSRRNEGADVIIIAHAKKDEDTKRHVPDVTGQSYQLMLRVCDELGYMSMVNNKRSIQFDPTDLTIGKNTAGLPVMEIPDKSDPAVRTFMQTIITSTRQAMAKHSEEQTEALEKSYKYQQQIGECTTPDCMTDLLNEVHKLPDYLKLPLQKLIGARAKDLGFISNKETRRFEAPPAADGSKPPAEEVKPAGKENPEDLAATKQALLDDRCKILSEMGMQPQLDGLGGFGLVITFEAIADALAEEFNKMINAVTEAKAPKTNKKSTSKKTVTA